MKQIIIISLILVTGYWLLVTLNPTPVFAARSQDNVCTKIGGTWDTTKKKCAINNPLGAGVTAQGAIGIVIKGLLGIVGVVALVFFVYGGFMWLTAAGDDKKYKAGWDIMTWATLGLVLIFGSTAIVSFILKIAGVD